MHVTMKTFGGLLAAAILHVPIGSGAQTLNTLVSGNIHGTSTSGGGGTGSGDISFTCTGEPTCSGRYEALLRPGSCTNTFSRANAILITGLDLSRTGSFQVVVTLRNFDSDNIPVNGICSIVPGSVTDEVVTLNATWDGSRGTLFAVIPEGNGTLTVTGTFSANRSAPAPVFPMTVTGSIDPVQANIAANIQFRPQDVGTTGSVYVFAVAPATVVRNALADPAVPLRMTAKGAAKADPPVQCVIAQLNAAGQLVGVSAANLQAYVTGVLSAQGQAVSILNGVPTVNIGGATFFVGYGPNATAMINGGVNRSAVTAPGALQCKPQAPQTGWWWNTAEGGRGYSIEVHGNNIFFAAFHYDVSGRSTWHVATGPTSLDGSLYNGELLLAGGGQTLAGSYPGFPRISSVGPFVLAFNDASNGTMSWPGGTVAIERFNIVPNGLSSAPKTDQPESGWWWNPSESGRGFFIEWQNGWADVAGYMYDEAGDPVWYLAVYETPAIRIFGGNWWSYANGQTMGGSYRPATRVSDNVAPVTIQFQSATDAILTLPGGRQIALTRHRF